MSNNQLLSIDQVVNSMLRNTVGLDHLAHRMGRTPDTFPPYNIIRRDNDAYTIEIALAGYNKNDLEVIQEDGLIIVKSAATKESDNAGDEQSIETVVPDYQYHGIAKRNFIRKFELGRSYFVNAVSMVDGILSLQVEKHEEAKPKVIEIT